jgi:hypothetical protein
MPTFGSGNILDCSLVGCKRTLGELSYSNLFSALVLEEHSHVEATGCTELDVFQRGNSYEIPVRAYYRGLVIDSMGNVSLQFV